MENLPIFPGKYHQNGGFSVHAPGENFTKEWLIDHHFRPKRRLCLKKHAGTYIKPRDMSVD